MDLRIGMFALVASMMLITLAAAQPAICTSETNISTGQTMGFSLAAVPYHITQNFITPDYAGLTVNGASFTLYPGVQQTLNQNTGSYVELTQINYIPRISSDNFILCSAQQTAQGTQYNFNLSAYNYGDLFFTYLGTKLIITANPPQSQAFSNFPTNVTITNVTSSTPAPPSGYSKLTALSISVATATPIGINMTQVVPCAISQSNIAIYKIVSGSWVAVAGYSLNSAACTVSATVPSDPIVGVFYIPSGSSTAPSTSSTSSTPTTSSEATTSMPTTTIASNATTQQTTQPTSSASTSSTTSASTSSTLESTSISTSISTTYTVTTTIRPSTSSSTISIPPQTTVPVGIIGSINTDLIRYAILGAIVILIAYVIYLVIHRPT